jgi:HSP20 family molecular chaperone IbpA
MAVIWPTPVYPNPYIQLDHPHPRTQHWNHLAALLPHAFGAAHTHPFTPDVDVRESATAFYIAVELPGLRDPKAVKLVWHNNRTLHAFGKTEYSFEGEKLQDATEEGEAERKKKAEELAEEDAKKNGVNGESYSVTLSFSKMVQLTLLPRLRRWPFDPHTAPRNACYARPRSYRAFRYA